MYATLLNPSGAPMNCLVQQEIDPDPAETIEWHESFHSLVAAWGPQRAAFILQELQNLAMQMRVSWQAPLGTPYINTISVDQQPAFPG